MTNNFFVEIIQRIAKDNPRFFKIIQYIAMSLAGACTALKFVDPTTHLPWFLFWIQSNTTLVASLVTVVMAQLPNKSVNELNQKKL